eukprot:UN17992
MTRLGIPFQSEPNKCHPRDFWNRGRLKFKLTNQGQTINTKSENKKGFNDSLDRILNQKRKNISNRQREAILAQTK